MITLQPDIEERRIILCHQFDRQRVASPLRSEQQCVASLAGTIGASGATDLEDGDDTQDQGESPNIEPINVSGDQLPSSTPSCFTAIEINVSRVTRMQARCGNRQLLPLFLNDVLE
jgi:hypothetical protein